jgi:tetratricopeptide (TPR) repeat protein
MSNQRYGRSFVQELLEDGREDEALTAAEQAVQEKPTFAAAHFDLGSVLEALGRTHDALGAYEAALLHNARERSVESFVLDDTYFSALIDAAQAAGTTDGPRILARYEEHAKDGGHASEVGEWMARLRGHAPSLLDKTR